MYPVPAIDRLNASTRHHSCEQLQALSCKGLTAQTYTSFSSPLATTNFPGAPALTVSSQPLEERDAVLG